jgi:hypothetical protein
MSGDFTSYTQKPDVEKFYTVTELAELFNVTCDTIRNISNRMNLPHDYVTRHKARLAIYPYESVKIIQEHFEAREKLRRLAEENRAKKIINDEPAEGNAEDHPLVTDKQYLKLSVWPDVTPKCFEELGE